MNDENKLIIYQVFTRLFGNNNNHCINNGSITENGCGKMADFTAKALGEIKKLALHISGTRASSSMLRKLTTAVTISNPTIRP
mgnify:FL=1